MHFIEYFDALLEIIVHDGAILLYEIPHVTTGRYFLSHADWRIP